MKYVIHLAIMISIFTTVNQGLGILMGFTGIVSVMQASIYGIGAYISALLALRLGVPFLGALLLAMIGAALCGIISSAFTRRIQGDYLALVTFGIALIFEDIFNNWLSLTHGPMGLPSIPRPFVSEWSWLIFVGSVAVASIALTAMIARSPFGRLLRAIRDDADLASVLGRQVQSTRIIAFIFAAILAGIAGSEYAHYVTFIDPSSFTVMESVTILAMVIVGGAESILGGLVGASLLILLPEILRFIGLPLSIAASLRQAFFGLLLLLCMLFRPQGFVGKYRMIS